MKILTINGINNMFAEKDILKGSILFRTELFLKRNNNNLKRQHLGIF